jgi:hypothetical protein
MDIVAHVAVCVSGDWEKIDKIVVGTFVTAIQDAEAVVYKGYF